jgi:hypothetical protein
VSEAPFNERTKNGIGQRAGLERDRGLLRSER